MDLNDIKHGMIILATRHTNASGKPIVAGKKYTIGSDLSLDDAKILIGCKKAQLSLKDEKKDEKEPAAPGPGKPDKQ